MKDKKCVEYFDIEGYKIPVILDNELVKSLYKSNTIIKYSMLGVSWDDKDGWAMMVGNELFFKLSKDIKKIAVLHELGHMIAGHKCGAKIKTHNEFLTQEHAADMYAVNATSKLEVLNMLGLMEQEYTDNGEENSMLFMRKILIDDNWDGPVPILKTTKANQKYQNKHKIDLKRCWELLNGVDLSELEEIK